MKTLPKAVRFEDGFVAVQVTREGGIGIYLRQKTIGRAVIGHYEVIVARGRQPYPDSEQWGERGFTCRTLDEAWERAARIRTERMMERASS